MTRRGIDSEAGSASGLGEDVDFGADDEEIDLDEDVDPADPYADFDTDGDLAVA